MVHFVKIMWLFYVLLSLFPADASGVSPVLDFEHLTTRDGLPGDFIEDIIQDHYGFIWLACRGGLARFNGVDFDVWHHGADDSTSIPNNFVTALFEYPEGQIWLGTLDGLGCMDMANFQCQRFTTLGRLSQAWITGMEMDDAGNLWLGTEEQGLFRLDLDAWSDGASLDSTYLTQYKFDIADSTGLSSNHVSDVLWLDGQRLLCVATTAGLNVYQSGKNEFSHYYFDHSTDTLSQTAVSSTYNSFHSLCRGAEDELWIGTNGGYLLQVAMQDDAVTFFKSYDFRELNTINSIAVDKFGDVWTASTLGSLVKLNPRTGRSKLVSQFEQKSRDNVTPGIRYFMFDRSSMLWVGARYGLYYIDPFNKGIMRVSYDPNRQNSLSTHKTTSLLEADDGRTWVGTIGYGLEIVDDNQNVVDSYRHDPMDKNSLCSDDVLSLSRGADGSFWIGTANGLDIVRQEGRDFLHVPHLQNNKNGLAGSNIFCLYRDSTNAFWAGTNRGISRIFAKGDSFEIENFLTDPSMSIKTLGGYVGAIHRLGDSCLLGSNGLFLFSPKNKSLQKYRHYEREWIGDMVIFIEKDSMGNYWVGTVSDGLYQFLSDGRQIHYTHQDGLPSNFVTGLLEDSTGCVWISTFKGLVKWKAETKIFENVRLPENLENEFVWRAFSKGASGRFYFCNYYGYIVFDPKDLAPNPIRPPVYTSQFKIYNRPVYFKKPIMDLDEITLTHKDKMFSLSFAALNYRQSRKNQYAYRLTGFAEEWIDASETHTAQFTNIPPGRYTFHVKASNNDGVWNEKGASIKIHIQPPWQRTTWAWMLWIGLFIAAIYGAYRLQLNRARLRQQVRLEHDHAEKLAQLDHVKSNFFANVSHEFRTPLTLILGPLEEIQQKSRSAWLKKQCKVMLSNGRRLLNLINQLLDFSALEAGGLKLCVSETDMVAFVKRVVASFMSLAERKQISLQFTAGERIILSYIDHEQFEKVLVNLLSNAFKFTPEKGRIDVSVDRISVGDADAVEIKIRDSGLGMARDQLDSIFNRFYQVNDERTKNAGGTGIGLALSKELVDLHGGRISVASEPGRGSEFTVRLPLGCGHFAADVEIVEDRVTESFFEPLEEELCEAAADDLLDDHRKPCVLIVEDNADVRQYVRDILTPDFRTREAADGEQGFAKAVERLPDLILSDVMMPVVDGFELSRRLKSDERTSHIPIILLTARASDAGKIEGLDLGVDDYVVKPFNARELKTRVKNLILQRKKLREKFSRTWASASPEANVPPIDERFLQRALELVEAHLDDPDFAAQSFAEQIGLSRMQLYRKLKALTNMTTSQFVAAVRLKRAAELLKSRADTVSQIAFQVGFNNPSYFAECFKKMYGVSPSQFGAERAL